ncbi:Zn-dependent exopeptidase [Daldinia caldariorum]|uniref:Zn-dependent exopeptidase n=1 Tax=Daldinia caldariorum TaxID=326644 RepID=UPI002008A80E|nr:Zn-dependent exopeptidase [Daldinia caldariorum]KAI1471879.1 Zn-dependent exopeptidase [Daldinia caldariorum]
MVRLLLVAALAATSTALAIGRGTDQEPLFTIQLEPGVTQQVTEAEKLALKFQGKSFIDITNRPNLVQSATTDASVKAAAAVSYPSALNQTEAVRGLISKLSRENVQEKLTTLTEFHSRFYNTTWAKDASDWLLSEVQGLLSESKAAGATVKTFEHRWAQNSIIATIPGRLTDKIVVGAHIDSINQEGWEARSPGADDDGSGSITNLEALKALLSDPKIVAGEADNTIEFHWYSGEELGLLGSGEIFDSYAADGVVVMAMLQQDMTGWGNNPMGVITDYVDQGLTAFIRLVSEYTDIGYVDTRCGYACSDHGSATAAGYPAAFVIESDRKIDNRNIHSAKDTLDTINYDHMLEHSKLVLGYVYELAFTAL